jgi:hypothetical protein
MSFQKNNISSLSEDLDFFIGEFIANSLLRVTIITRLVQNEQAFILIQSTLGITYDFGPRFYFLYRAFVLSNA